MFKEISLHQYDPELATQIDAETKRQEDHIELIASENYCSPAVMQAQGSTLTNKYAEGYKLFGADYVNVQPHSGSSANSAVFLALLEPNDTVLGMSLAHGGHLTHGASVNFSGRNYHAVQYGLDTETGLIDYEEVARLAREHKPKMIIAGFSAYSQIIDWQKFRDIADEVGAYLMADMAHVAGLVAAGIYPSPVQIADVTTTTTHKTLRGPRSGLILAKANEEIEKKLASAVFPGSQGGPLMHAIAAKAVCFKEAMSDDFQSYQKQVIINAKAMAEVIQSRGYEIVSGGTKNHLMLISLIKQGITGKEADKWLGDAHITVNKNSVPNDPKSPFVTSGIRIGTPAITTRGFGEAEVRELAGWICDVLDARGDEAVLAATREKVAQICNKLPVYERNVA
ncbi:serine hydroxymethyltransferase [Moraxella catarrhalis]|uniref:serine hydroxymethyltransferase n=1 Tax=Moraxella catarrhalis TaxID=480 RepID=UPI0007E3405B|nr:serine hydroxymethyltransferase [Moraxella catarrhalis]OAV06278.1 Serine hydroxymethyltransferase [Moraxella catarrhalis]